MKQVTVFSADEEKAINDAAGKLYDAYNPIIDKMDKHSVLQCFIADVLNDFLYDMGEEVVNFPEENFPRYWQSIKDYTKTINSCIENARDDIIKIFLVFRENEHDLSEANIMADESTLQDYSDLFSVVNDISQDYYMRYLVGCFDQPVDSEKLGDLDRNEKIVLNAILKRSGFKGLNDDE